ncbi:glutamine synthetase, partial [Candidatus Microgenomates bacterium]|nr:glutamine synthetase [Candidatus Microgenomates bacterium]
LAHIREITGITNPNVNSYKRLTPGYEAPVYVCWARINRSALIRVPKISRGLESKATRLEIRCPDPSNNPYLAFAVLLKAGLEGIKNKLKAPSAVEENLYQFDDEKLAKYYITKLPVSLWEAIEEMKKGRIVREVFGEHAWKRYLEAKTAEWDSFRISVTDWEIDRYLKIL